MRREDLLHLMQAGSIEIVAHYSALEERCMLLRFYHVPVTVEMEQEILQCLYEHHEVYYLVRAHDQSVCGNTPDHQASYVQAQEGERSYIKCNACECRRRSLLTHTDEELLETERIDFQTYGK